jgi:hypothetical protein
MSIHTIQQEAHDWSHLIFKTTCSLESNNNLAPNTFIFIAPFPTPSVECPITIKEKIIYLLNHRSFTMTNEANDFFHNKKVCLRYQDKFHSLDNSGYFRGKFRFKLPKINKLPESVYPSNWLFCLENETERWVCDQLKIVDKIPELVENKMALTFLLNPVDAEDNKLPLEALYPINKNTDLSLLSYIFGKEKKGL